MIKRHTVSLFITLHFVTLKVSIRNVLNTRDYSNYYQLNHIEVYLNFGHGALQMHLRNDIMNNLLLLVKIFL